MFKVRKFIKANIPMPTKNLGHDERLPLYQRLREEIAEKIAAGEWLPEEVIPTEAELTQHYGVAVGTVRKAVDALVNEGLLERRQGSGTFVRRPNFDTSLFRFFRQDTGDNSVQIPESRILSRELHPASREIAAALNIEPGDEVIHLKRTRMFNEQTLFLEDIWLSGALFGALKTMPLRDFGNLLYPLHEQTCGQRIAKAQETLTIESADELTAATLSVEPGQPIVVIERIARGYDKQPLEYRLSRGAAETFRYRVEIS